MTGPSVGPRVLVPRTGDAAGPLDAALTAAGVRPHVVALLGIGPPTDEAAFDGAVLALAAGDYSWVGFASAHGVAAVVDRAAALHVTVPADTRVAAVGAATGARLRAAGIPVDLQPAHGGSAATLVEVWPHAAPGQRVLLPSSEIGLTVLADGLSAKGWSVDHIAAYAPRPVAAPIDVVADLVAGRYAAVVLTSPSLARAVAALHPSSEVRTVAIGATTAAGAAAAGLRVDAVADDPTPAGLTAAMRRALRDPGRDAAPP